MRTCQKCGAEVEKDDKFCPECGEKVVKEARTITVGSILKVLLIVIFFIVLLNVFKSMSGASPILFLIFIIFFIVWSGILNWFLKKLFDVKISTGVKLIITIAILLILFFGAKMATQRSVPMISSVSESPAGEVDVELYNLVGEVNNVLSSKDNRLLEVMVEKGEITSEVFEDLKNVITQSQDVSISFNPRGNNFLGTHAEMNTEVLLRRDYNERKTGVVLVFEKKGPTSWTLIKISPKLTDIKLEKSFEEETAYNIEKIKSEIICEPPKIMYQGECCLDVDNSGVCDTVEEALKRTEEITQQGDIMGGAKKACTQYCGSNLCGLFVSPGFPQPELKGKNCLDLGVQCGKCKV
jgi:predicted nucleic acid-binding Zn ribbon protein